MPGIFGLLVKPFARADQRACAQAVGAMASAMLYERFYTHRRVDAPELGIFAGWVGPAEGIADRGPQSSDDGLVTLIASGEPFAADGRPKGRLDLAAEKRRILADYDRQPDAFPSSVEGRCAGLLIDRRRESVVLFNDRLGMERLFVYENGGTFYFASEAKAILAAVPETRAFDPKGLAELLTCGCTLGTSSLFRNVRVLPAASVLRTGRQRPGTIERYFDLAEWQNAEPLDARAFAERLQAELDDVVMESASREEAAAISLTGGLDSRMIVASLPGEAGSLETYTFGSMYRDTYDVRVARRVAAACGFKHHVLALDRAFVSNVSDYFEKAVYIADGTLGLSGAAELYVNGLARSVAPIRVTGNYGGELLRSFRAFKSVSPRDGFLRPELAEPVREAVETFERTSAVDPLTFTLFHQAPAGYGRYAIERSQVTVRSPFLDSRIARLLYRRPADAGSGFDVSVRLIGARRPDLLSIPTDRGLLGGDNRLSRKVRRAIREITFKAEYMTGHGAPNWMAAFTRRVPGNLLERAFRGRHKFVHPRPWFRTELGQFARELLLGAGMSHVDRWFEPSQVRRMMKSDLQGATNHSEELDKVITIALAARLLKSPSNGIASDTATPVRQTRSVRSA